MNVALVLCALIAHAADVPSAVLKLSSSQLEDALTTHSILLVGFFAPWCTHCNQMAVAWEGAATTLMERTPPIRVATIDGSVETKLARRLKIEGFPAIKLFRHGSAALDFDGPRTKRALVEFALEAVQPEVQALKSAKALTRLLRVRPAVALLLEPVDQHSTAFRDAFVAAAHDGRGLAHPTLVWASAVDAAAAAAIAAKLGVAATGAPTLVMLRAPSTRWKATALATLVASEYAADRTSAAAIGAWAALERHPLVYVFDDFVARALYGGAERTMHLGATPAHLLLFAERAADLAPRARTEKKQRASDALERNFEELCARLRGELLCVLVPATEERVLVQFDLDLDAKGALPAAMILKFAPHAMLAFRAPKSIAAPLSPWRWHASEGDVEGADAVSVLLFTVTFHANHAHNLTRSP